jgi:LysM repeat protein
MIRLAAVLFIFLGAISIQAQDFISHTVQPKETIYGICKQYNITQEDLVKYNSFLVDGLKIGQVLTIPLAEKHDNGAPQSEELYILHRVQAKETIYGICKQYEITESELLRMNPELKDGLKVGTLVKIPVAVDISAPAEERRKEQEREKVSPLKPHKRNDKVYNIGLALPLYLKANDSLEIYAQLGEDPEVFSKSIVALDFFMGFRMAMDSLEKMGFESRIHLWDTERNNSMVRSIFEKPEIASMDLIVGPLFTENITEAVKVMNEKGVNVPVVNPFSKSMEPLNMARGMVQLTPEDDFFLEKYIDLVIRKSGGEVIHLVAGSSERDSTILYRVSTYLYSKLDSSRIAVHQTSYGTISGLDWASKDKGKVVILSCSRSKVLYTDLVTKLNAKRNTNIYFYFLQNPTDMDLEFVYLENLHATWPELEFVNYKNEATAAFVKNYQDRYKTDPSRYSFHGFQIGFYFGKLLYEYGSVFPAMYQVQERGIITHMNFIPSWDDAILARPFVLTIEDFMLKEVE